VPAEAGLQYEWTYSGAGATIIGTGAAITINFGATATSGDLSVKATNVCGTSAAKTTAIVVNPLVSTPGEFTASPATVCQGSDDISYTVPADAAATSYDWSYSGTGAVISGDGNSVTVSFNNNATSGTLSVKAQNDCSVSAARTINITVNPLPASPGLFTNGPASVCTGTSDLNYEVTGDASATYVWAYSGTGATITGTSNAVTVSFSETATSGNLSVMSSNSCGESAASIKAITIKPTPAQPVISVDATDPEHPVLTSSVTADKYTWFLAGEPAGTKPTITVKTNGEYTLAVSNKGCASILSAPQSVNITGVDPETNSPQIGLYPNPASHQVVISLEDFERNKPVAISIVDLQGKVMTETTGSGKQNVTVNVSQYSSGKYMVLMNQYERFVSLQFIKK
jgi:hypothetical protein